MNKEEQERAALRMFQENAQRAARIYGSGLDEAAIEREIRRLRKTRAEEDWRELELYEQDARIGELRRERWSAWYDALPHFDRLEEIRQHQLGRLRHGAVNDANWHYSNYTYPYLARYARHELTRQTVRSMRPA